MVAMQIAYILSTKYTIIQNLCGKPNDPVTAQFLPLLHIIDIVVIRNHAKYIHCIFHIEVYFNDFYNRFCDVSHSLVYICYQGKKLSVLGSNYRGCNVNINNRIKRKVKHWSSVG